MHLGANLLLPGGFDEHPEARYPLVIIHGHFPYTFERFIPRIAPRILKTAPPGADIESWRY